MSGRRGIEDGKSGRKEEEEESLTQRRRDAERGTQEKIWKVVAFDRKNPPFRPRRTKSGGSLKSLSGDVR